MESLDKYIDQVGTNEAPNREVIAACVAGAAYEIVTSVDDCKTNSTCYAVEAAKGCAWGVTSYYIHEAAVNTNGNDGADSGGSCYIF